MHTLTIPRWQPARINQWDGAHWSKRCRLKKIDRQIVGMYARLAGIPPAAGKRRVSMHITLGPGQRGADPDAYWKSLLDALVSCRLLTNDNSQAVELGPVTFGRGAQPATEIYFHDASVSDASVNDASQKR